MNKWVKMDEHYIQRSQYTITKTPNVTKPYCLFKDVNPPVLYGCFETLDEAIKRYEEIK